MVFLEQTAGFVHAAAVVESDERAVRRTLRDQIARLERELGSAVTAAYPRLLAAAAVPSHPGPRLLSLGELEIVRDELADRLAAVRQQAALQAERQAQKRLLIERMLLEPARFKWVRVCNEDIGEPGCKQFHVRPRLGLVGMLAGWWHIKISSGCPLAT
ncbi:MAG TPA: hypothetical protein VES79_01985 [Solirubrobacteraceae bacterium]|nr:hypothetical protein [Solirubrobacteraceae bacterium]